MTTSFAQSNKELQRFIRGYVQLYYPTNNGTLAQQLEFIKKNNLAVPKTMNGRDVPEEVELNAFESWIYNEWMNIGKSRSYDNGLPRPISDITIKTYMELMQVQFRLVDIELIKTLDEAFINELAVQRELNKE